MSSKITIIGAGSVGSTIAYTLSSQDIASEIVLIDINKQKAEGEVLDIIQGTCFRDPISIIAGDYEDAKDSDIVIITSGIARKPGQTRLELTQTNVNILKSITPEIVKAAPNALYLIVSNPVDIMTYVFTKISGLPENQILGSGTILDSARLRCGLSEHFQIAQSNIHAYVFGEHGDTSFIPWSGAYISGVSVDEYYDLEKLVEDALGAGLFANVRTVEDFYLQVSMLAGDRMKEKENTLIFLDEIQAYPHLLTMLKFLAQDGRFTYIASGSLLGVTLAQTPSIPMGSIRKVQMFPLDFEEFLYANGLNEFAITAMRRRFEALEALDEATHNKVMDLFRKYLLVGGLPDAVNTYLAEKNIQTVREIQREIHDYYAADASKYGEERKLMIRRIYDLIPSNMENKKKRVVAKSIEDKKGKTFRDYSDEFEYLISAGIALPVQAISNPIFPLIESAGKNLLKLYLNDVGLLTCLLYGNNIRAVLDDEKSINLGSVYETVVASELAAHGYKLYYYDNRSKGEVDYLIDDYSSLSAVPLEVKSGKDYTVHSALNTFVQNEDYHIKKAFVLSNERKVSSKGKITYLPIYYVMFFSAASG